MCVVTLCLVLSSVGPAAGASAFGGGTAGIGADKVTDDFELEYFDRATSSHVWPASETLMVYASGETFQFGPEASNRIRVRDVDTGEPVTLSPASGEETHQVNLFNFDPKEVYNSENPDIGVNDPSTSVTNESIDVEVDGDTDMFSRAVFHSLRVQVIDEDGTVLAETGVETHGVGYEEPELRYNGSHLAVERDPAVEDDWYVEIDQGWVDVEMTNEDGTEFFVVSVQGTEFNETDEFDVDILPDESAPLGDRIIGLSDVVIGEDDYVDGPVVGEDRGEREESNRTLSSTTVPPNGTVTVTMQTSVDSDTVAFGEAFRPALEGASIQDVTVDGETVDTTLSVAEEAGISVVVDNVTAGDTATVVYTVSAPADAEPGTTYSIDGTVTDEETVELPGDEITITEGSLDGAAADYDVDGDGAIDIGELNSAAQDFIDDHITITELNEVAQAFVGTT